MKNTKTKKEVKSHLTMLLENKGYTLVHKGQQGNDIYLAIEPETGNVCIITANEGSQYFKEIILPLRIVLVSLVQRILDKSLLSNGTKAESFSLGS